MRKSQLLYGLPVAVQSTGPIVVVEGPTDVWRLETNAVALFGKDLSIAQQQLLDQHFRGRPVVLFLDRDARDKSLEIRRRLRSGSLGASGRPIVIAEPPPGRDDVGDCTHEEAWHQINRALERAVTCPAGA
jgi:DNA primase